MAKNVDCPFCGLVGPRTGEHVWAQWMHSTPGAVALLKETHGERIQLEQSRLHRGEDGRYRHEAVPTRMARWLPNVKVDVCAACNNGWMSDLETAAKNILGPLILEGTPHLRLSKGDLLTLATWATKSWMGYALLRLPHQNPFTIDEYRMMSTTPAPLARSQVWLLHSVAPGAYVSMALESTLVTFRETPSDMATTQDNFAYAFLAVGTVVLYLQLLPPDTPSGMAEEMAPPVLAEPRLARQIWPHQRPQFYPLDTLPSGGLDALVRWGPDLFNAIGLPTVGLDDDDTRAVLTEFHAGVDPVELRRRWNQPD